MRTSTESAQLPVHVDHVVDVRMCRVISHGQLASPVGTKPLCHAIRLSLCAHIPGLLVTPIFPFAPCIHVRNAFERLPGNNWCQTRQPQGVHKLSV